MSELLVSKECSRATAETVKVARLEQTTKTGTTGVIGIVFTHTLAVLSLGVIVAPYAVLSTTSDNMDVSNTRRIVILGKTGAGKSSLANTIFGGGKELFPIAHTLDSETKECQIHEECVNGRRITLIDTPGFFDTNRSEEELKREIVRCITECAPGPNAFLIVLKVEKFTEHEQAVITKICQYFSEEALKYATVLFTHGDQIPEGQTIEDMFNQFQPVIDLVKKCGGRCHVIDNKYWKNKQQNEYRSNKFQVEELLKTIDKMIETNKRSCYTNDMLQAVEEKIQQEEEQIRESAGNMSEVQIREQAKGSTFKSLLKKLAGFVTGALLGAFFGFKKGHAVITNAGGAMTGEAEKLINKLPGAGAAIGAFAGGLTGYDAAEEADTLWEAVQRAVEAVKDEDHSASSSKKVKTESRPKINRKTRGRKP